MNKIRPFLWFDTQAEEAMNFYVSIFKNSEVLYVNPGPNGVAQSVGFVLEGQEFMAMNAGPQYKFNEAISLFVDCQTQEEVDALWENLTANGGEEGMCGWLKDKYGLSWQIVPAALGEILGHQDREKANRAIQAMLQMKKIVVADLQKAFESA
jgi:predicted 3-demethylubiquinone-9 3-methyltransferase (glyoxalase superfamily)